jgi:hypothetical protein
MTGQVCAHALSDVKVFQARPVPVCLRQTISREHSHYLRATTSDSQVFLLCGSARPPSPLPRFSSCLRLPLRGTEQAERQDKTLIYPDHSFRWLRSSAPPSSCFSRDSARLLEPAGDISRSADSISALRGSLPTENGRR